MIQRIERAISLRRIKWLLALGIGNHGALVVGFNDFHDELLAGTVCPQIPFEFLGSVFGVKKAEEGGAPATLSHSACPLFF